MLKAKAALNESTGGIDSLLPSPSPSASTTTVADTTELIASNMDETSAHKSTDEPSKSNLQSANESNASKSDECETTSTAATLSPPSTDNALTHIASSGDKSVTGDSSRGHPTKKKAVHLLSAPHVETIRDDIAATTEDIKRLKHVQVRSNSTGKLYQSSRRVSFPENDSELVTGYLEPADPWACGESDTILFLLSFGIHDGIEVVADNSIKLFSNPFTFVPGLIATH